MLQSLRSQRVRYDSATEQQVLHKTRPKRFVVISHSGVLLKYYGVFFWIPCNAESISELL